MTSEEDAPRVLSKGDALRIAETANKLAASSGSLKLVISSWWGGGQRWSRNKLAMSSDQREIMVTVERRKNKGVGRSETNQLDMESLEGVIGIAEYYADLDETNIPLDRMMERAVWNPVGTNVWSDSTFNSKLLESAAAISRVTQMAAMDSFLSAGYVGTTASTALVFIRDEWGRVTTDWGEVTEATCSMTVRHPKGLGSGWAARTSFDMSNIDIDKLAVIAYEKCKASVEPVRIEPGRYTTILEPQAAGELFGLIVGSLRRNIPEAGNKGPMLGGHDQGVQRFYTKLGWKILDERINVYHDPEDPLVGTHPQNMVSRIDMINKGVLRSMFNDYEHELRELSELNPNIQRMSFRVDGSSTTIEEMIRSTRRGLLVAKLAQVQVIDGVSLLSTGVTRDGVWLIENGSISKAVKNFRWIESPMFAFNNVDQIGLAEPISKHTWSRAPLGHSFHNSLTNVVVPTMKVRDFNFSSLIDAI